MRRSVRSISRPPIGCIKNVPASLRGSRKTFPLIPFGREGFARNAALPRRDGGGAIAISDCGGTVILNFGPRLVEDRASSIGRPIRSNAHQAAAAVNRGENREPRRMPLARGRAGDDRLTDAGFKLGWQVRQRQAARVARPPPAAPGLPPPPRPSMRSPSHQ
jgi:hypothetical protein